MALFRLPRRAQWLVAAPVEADRQWRKRNFPAVEGDAAIAREVQANLDAAGMKTSAPVKFRVRLEVVPLETHARSAHTAVQMPPAFTNRRPRRAFGEHKCGRKFRRFAGFNRLFDWFWHVNNVPSLTP